MFFKPQPIHFTGIGGIGMSGLAEVLLEMGYRVTGSDLKLSPVTERLTRLGAVVYQGHAATNIAGANAIVVTSAARADNPEIVEARRRGIALRMTQRRRDFLLAGAECRRHPRSEAPHGHLR